MKLDNTDIITNKIIYEPKLGMTFMNVDNNIYEYLTLQQQNSNKNEYADLKYGYYVKKVSYTKKY